MRWAAFLILLLCSAGGVVLVMIWLAHNGVRQRYALDHRLVLGHCVGAVAGVAIFAWGMARGDAGSLHTAALVTSAAFVAGGMLVASWLWRRRKAASDAAEAPRSARDVIIAGLGRSRLRVVIGGAERESYLEQEPKPLQLVAGDEMVAARAPVLPRGGGGDRRDGHLQLVAGALAEADARAGDGDGELSVADDEELGDLSFVAAGFDWRAIGIHDDGTSADDHLPPAIVVAHGLLAFAALVLMFAAAG
jgi:hypothetical protein